MELSLYSVAISFILVTVSTFSWKVLNWVWLKPKKLEKCLRQQGLTGHPYRLLFGDFEENAKIIKEATSRPINFSDDIAQRATPLFHQTLKNYGKNSFTWNGPIPRVHIMNPEHIKDIFNNISDFPKPNINPLMWFLITGLLRHKDEKWVKHRKIINPAFHQEKLKHMLPAFHESCSEMINSWEKLFFESGSCELDIWPYLMNMTSDVISKTSFGSSYEEGRRIFQLLTELSKLTTEAFQSVYIPGWRFLPTKKNKKMKEINKEIQALIKGIINKRVNALKASEVANNDLLGMLMESNYKEIHEHGNNKNAGMSIKDVIEECKIFYLAGEETTAVLLVWTMILLSKYSDWQARAREEVLQVFGNNKPDHDGLNHLKVVTMILYEVLRLYPPVVELSRTIHKETQIGNLTLPAEVELLMPVILIHHDYELWGDDAMEFKPERFADGVSKATKNRVSFLPFGWGPRICIGQNFSMLEAKMVMTMILQKFSFELSPSYVHAPYAFLNLQPEYGAHLILHKL